MDTRSYRNELKFLCTEQELCLIENKIRHICKPDAHAGAGGIYAIKSLYFDTYDDRCYYENMAGADNRKKYRIRIYNDDTDVIKLECKYSRHGKKAKETCNITRQQYEALMSRDRGQRALLQASSAGSGTEKSNGEAGQLLQRFLVEMDMDLLMPKIIVAYRRTPYVYAAGNVRITFDRAISSSPQTAQFLTKNVVYRNIMPEDVHILEVKYDEFIPAAILEMVTAGRSLRRTSFSKYALCREYNI